MINRISVNELELLQSVAEGDYASGNLESLVSKRLINRDFTLTLKGVHLYHAYKCQKRMK